MSFHVFKLGFFGKPETSESAYVWLQRLKSPICEELNDGEGFAVAENGELMLYDSCGNYAWIGGEFESKRSQEDNDE